MKNSYLINKFALQLIVLLASPTGLVSLLVFLTLFDGVSNALAVGEIFADRMVDLVIAFGFEEAKAKNLAKIIATVFSLFASSALGFGILVSALQQPSKKEQETRMTDGEGKMQTATRRLGWISFFMSFVGYMVFLTKGKNAEELYQLFFIVQALMACLLAGFVPYLFTKVSLHLREKYGDVVDMFVNDLVTELKVKMAAQIRGLSEEDTQQILNRRFKGRRMDKSKLEVGNDDDLAALEKQILGNAA